MIGPAEKELLFTFELHQADLPSFQVINLEGEEAVSQLFNFEITLVSNTPDVDLQRVLNTSATLRIWSRDHSRSVPYQGMLAVFEQLGHVDNYYFYRAVLAPRLWRLNLTWINDVYVDEQRIPDIIQRILDRNNLKGSDVRINVKNDSDFRKRSFVCQYQETDLSFISRWMESEGLYYFFEHEDDQATGEVLCITDYKEGQPNTALTLRYTPPENIQTGLQDSCVTAFNCRKTHVPGKVLVQDFNFRNAILEDDLKYESGVAHGQTGAFMFYGDNLRDEDEAKRLARIRAEELSCRNTLFTAEAYAIGVRSGRFITVTHHFRDDYNTKYWVTRVRHKGSQTGVVLSGQTTLHNDGEQGSTYQCFFEAQPADQQFRAPRTTPKPVISGVLSAIIDAKDGGDMAEINEYGQYKVQFMFDYSEKSANQGSSWLRMLTPYAGKHEGMHFPLLKGTEVLIGFIGGDPDQPIIMGAAPNSETRNIVRDINAACNGVRTNGGNIMNMVDKPGQEVIAIYSPAQTSGIYIGTFPTVGPDVSLSAVDPVKVLKSIT